MWQMLAGPQHYFIIFIPTLIALFTLALWHSVQWDNIIRTSPLQSSDN